MIVDVAIPLRVNKSFHYLLPEDQIGKLKTGSLIEVNFGRKKTFAFVLGFPEESDVPESKLKPIHSVLSEDPLFDEQMLEFLTWVSRYYSHPLGEVIATAIPKQCWEFKTKKTRKKESDDGSQVMGLTSLSTEKHALTPDQTAAVASILESDKPTLLHGVTGSGKTEVYLQLLEETLKEGKGAIVLVPEISLTPQLLGRFSTRFPGEIAVLHSNLTPRERRIQWERLYLDKAKVVIGPRSAVFAPIKDLGLIVVDEEHESSFKQEDSLRYHGRDVAVIRGHLQGARVVLGTATPSLESYHNADLGKYNKVRLKSRINQKPLPEPTFVNLKDTEELYSKEVPWLSKYLFNKITETVAKKEQVLLYLNRLGFSHFLYCLDCGHTWHCKNCDVSLTYYQKPRRILKCHYCSSVQPSPETCEECSGRNIDAMGVGTEQVEKQISELFPDARVARMDRSVVQTRKALEQLLERIAQKEVDIVIGTQMVTKGHDFPGISLVGILVADSSLAMPDFRAHEKTFQTITQVAGRAGRAELPGQVIIQSINPEHPVLQAAAHNKIDEFYGLELKARQQFGYPPFKRMAVLRFQHKNPATVRQFANQVITQLQSHRSSLNCEFLGPAEAPLSRVKQLHRWMCLVKSENIGELQKIVRYALEVSNYQKSSVQAAVDMDPVNLF